jgi:DHA2 family multidrug resistance protein-like MFS transporter
MDVAAQTSAGSSQPARASRRDWIGLAVLALPCMVYAMDLTVLNLALPRISEELRPSAAQLLWIVDIYGFLVAGFLITMGNLGDRIGRRRLLLAGAAAFAVASTIAAFATDATMLILMRALLGIAGATLAPSTLSLIRNMFHEPTERQFAIGVWIASFSVGGAIGPLVGGLMLQFFPWGSVFLVAVPVMLGLLLLGPLLLPEYRDPDAGRLDPPSIVLSLVSVLTTIYGLKSMAEHGLALRPLAVMLLGLVLGHLFVRRQQRLTYPLLEMKLFRQPRFSAAIAAYALSCLAMFGVYIFITQYFQLVLGLAPLQAGLATVPWSIAFVVGSLLAPKLARRVPAVSVLVWGLAAAALGFALLVLADTGWWLAAVVVGTVIMSLGMAPVFTLGNEMIIMAAPPERAGAASGISETSSEFSGALGIALFGSLGTAIYRMGLGAGLADAVPPGARADALATLGGAISVAQELPGPAGVQLLADARAAFVTALQVNATIAAATMVAASVLAARMLRTDPARGPEASFRPS